MHRIALRCTQAAAEVELPLNAGTVSFCTFCTCAQTFIATIPIAVSYQIMFPGYELHVAWLYQHRPRKCEARHWSAEKFKY